MTPDQWGRVKEIFLTALERDGSERRAFLDRACAGDTSLLEQVETLLASDQTTGAFLKASVAELAAEAGLAGSCDTLTKTGIERDPAESLVGRLAGSYRISGYIGRGGMGRVYLAERADGHYRKRVAIKFIQPGLDSTVLVRRFRNERQVMAALDHPHIARLLDGGATEDGLLYLVMEYVEGERIDTWCDKRSLSIYDRLKLFQNVCTAVQYAHEKQIIHRDLKPGNILVTEDGTPKLLDFGIAKLLDPELSAQTGEVTAGTGPITPECASPEQVRGEPLGPSSDIYALGLMLYRLLTGRLPYAVPTHDLRLITRVICEQEPEKPSTAILSSGDESGTRGESPTGLHRLLSGDLDTVVLKALRKEPQRRYTSAAQFANDIDRFLHDLPVEARRGSLTYRWQKFVKRHRAPLIVAAMTVALGTAAITSAHRSGFFGSPPPAGGRSIAPALSTSPEALRAYEAGLIERAQFRLAEAHTAIQHAIDLDPRFVMAYYQLADLQRYSGDVSQARRTIAHAVQLSELTSAPPLSKLLAKAFQLRLDQQLNQASEILEKSRREFAHDTEPLLQLAGIRAAEGRFGEAVVLLEEAVRIDERHSLAHQQLGYQYAFTHDLPRAMASIERYAALLPSENDTPAAIRGDVYLISERFKEAIEQYRRIRYRLPMAVAAMYAGDYTLAESTLGRGGPQTYSVLGDLAFARGEQEKAVRHYESAAKLYDSEGTLRSWSALLKLARILHEQHMPKRVLALSLRHNTPWAAGLRGTAYLLLQEQAKAEREFTALRVSIAPVLGEYVADKAVEFHRMQAASYAGHYDRVIQMWPNLPRSFWSLYALDIGRAYLHAGLFSDAEHHLRLASAVQLGYFLNGDVPAQHNLISRALAQFYLGQLLEKTRRQSEAIANYQAFLRPFDQSSALFPQIAIARAAVARSQLSQRGRLLFNDEFNGEKLGAGWTDDAGSWELSGGVAVASQRPSERRQAERRHAVIFHDAIFEFSFRLDGASRINLSIGNSLGNLCRLHITRGGLSLALAKTRSSNLRPEMLNTTDTDIESGKWHKLVCELRGRRMLAQLNDTHTVVGESPRLDVDKTDFGLLVSGASASFDYVRLYQIGTKRVRPSKSGARSTHAAMPN